jgi:hypothetical protein
MYQDLDTLQAEPPGGFIYFTAAHSFPSQCLVDLCEYIVLLPNSGASLVLLREEVLEFRTCKTALLSCCFVFSLSEVRILF